MKKILMILFAIVIPVFSQSHTRIDLTVETDKGEFRNYNKIGVHPDATYKVDTEIGEKSLPTFPPPSGLHCYLIYYDTLGVDEYDLIYTREEYKPIPKSGGQFHHRYKMKIYKESNDTLIFGWGEIPANIDSAYFTDVGEILFKVDMQEQSGYKVENNFVEEFYFDVYYSFPTSVEEIREKELTLYPNPATDRVSVDVEGIYNVEIMDVSGRIILEKKKYSGGYIDISNLSKGFYLIRFTGDKNFIEKFMKY